MPHPVQQYSDDVVAARKKLARNTYQGAGTAVGALAGAALGTSAVAGAHLGLKLGRVKATTPTKAYLVGGGLGAVGGALAGKTIGTVIRRKDVARQKPNELSIPMNKNVKSRLVRLNAKLDRQVNFAYQDDEDKTLRNTAIGAGALGAGYAGASVLRGRNWQKNVLGKADNSASGILGALKTGNQLNVADASRFVTPAADAISNAAGTVANKAVAVGRTSKAALLQAARRAGKLRFTKAAV